MKEIYYQLKNYWIKDVKVSYLISLWLFLGVAIYFNYQLDFENLILHPRSRSTIYPFLIAAYYGIPYLYAFVLYAYFYKAWYIFRLKKFWIPVLVAITALTLDETFYWHLKWIETHISTPADMNFTYNCAQNFISAFLYSLPILVYWIYYDRKKMPLYGFDNKKFKAKPYFLMLAFMLPLLIVASFRSDFLENYPVYNDWGFSIANALPKWISITLFEFCYGLDFVAVEFLFRGFMVIALIDVLGADSILPMATVYCVYHFGKPCGETIGAFFGGMILGVLAYNSRSIYGGIFVHLGIAFMMELLAFFAKCNIYK